MCGKVWLSSCHSGREGDSSGILHHRQLRQQGRASLTLRPDGRIVNEYTDKDVWSLKNKQIDLWEVKHSSNQRLCTTC